MKNTVLKVDKEMKEPVIKMVNKTILGNCLYLNKRNIYSYSKRKHYNEQYGNWRLLNALSEPSKKQLSGNAKGLQLRVRVFPNSNTIEPIADELCAVSRANKAYTVSWNKKIKIALQRLFPVSKALAISCVGNRDINNNSPLAESISISTFTETNGNGGWNIYPNKIAEDTIQNNDISKEYQLMLSALKDYAKDLYLSTSKEYESSREHANVFEKSIEWKDASEFKGIMKAKQNCIYTLASEPEQDGKCKVYVGEAKLSGTRLNIFNIDGKTYIDHTRKEAEEHRFTRFRIDTLKSEALEYLHDAQDSIIGALVMLTQECPNGYKMTNEQLCSAISKAYELDKYKRSK